MALYLPLSRRFGKARTPQCACTSNLTCSACLAAAPPYHWSPTILGRTWYTDSQPAILRVGGGDAHLGAALLAATSPRCQILDNLRRALRRTSPLPCHATNLQRALSGQPLRGPKVTAFAAALSGDPAAIPVDIWLCRAFGQPDDPSLRHIREVQRRVRHGARLRRLTPRDYAAVVWCSTITAWGRTPMHYGHALTILESQHERPTSPQGPSLHPH